MPSRFLLLTALVLLLSACSSAPELTAFAFESETQQLNSTEQKSGCGFAGLTLPPDVALYAAGAYTGRKTAFQIDQSGHQATQIDVAVNSADKPVVLMLGAYEPTIWRIGWSPGTRILAVLASGYHRQVIAGLPSSVPQRISTYDNAGPCGYFYLSTRDDAAPNALALPVFGQSVNAVFHATRGRVVVGNALPAETRLVTSPEITPESFHDRDTPVAGPAGLQEAVRKGLLRKANPAQASAWADAVGRNLARSASPDAGVRRAARAPMHNAYVVLKSFSFPAGLYGAHSAVFFVPRGVPRPDGNPGHSSVYDFNMVDCQDPMCAGQ